MSVVKKPAVNGLSSFILRDCCQSGSNFQARRGAICLKNSIVPAICQKLCLHRSGLKPGLGNEPENLSSCQDQDLYKM